MISSEKSINKLINILVFKKIKKKNELQ